MRSSDAALMRRVLTRVLQFNLDRLYIFRLVRRVADVRYGDVIARYVHYSGRSGGLQRQSSRRNRFRCKISTRCLTPLP